MIEESALSIVGLTLEVAALSTALILVPGVAAAAFLARYRGPGRAVLDTVLSLPLVLPPTAVGLVLLQILSPRHAVGRGLAAAGLEILFTPAAVVLACAVMSFPLLVRSARTSFEEVDPRLVGLARTLGRGRLGAFFAVTLPLARRGVLAGALLAFSRALGEFGATIMVAGSIPGRTRTLALAIFHDVQLGNDRHALGLAAATVALAFAVLWTTERLTRGRAPETRA